jgi:uncharacterized membrane protein
VRPRGAAVVKALVVVLFLASEWYAHTVLVDPAATAKLTLTLALLYGVPHAVIYSVLAWFFGRTLVAGGEPLITRLARRVHGALPPAMELYTRRITMAWCLFFCAQVAASATLALAGALEAWSLLVNRLNMPLVAAMFVGEYLYRVIRHRDFPHASIPTAVKAFIDDSRARSVRSR